MDRVVWVAMTGAKHLMHRQEVLANNLANAATTGFRADLESMRAVPTTGPAGSTRPYAVESTPASDFTPGAIQRTGAGLDAAKELIEVTGAKKATSSPTRACP